jgi:hypothetical protein
MPEPTPVQKSFPDDAAAISGIPVSNETINLSNVTEHTADSALLKSAYREEDSGFRQLSPETSPRNNLSKETQEPINPAIPSEKPAKSTYRREDSGFKQSDSEQSTGYNMPKATQDQIQSSEPSVRLFEQPRRSNDDMEFETYTRDATPTRRGENSSVRQLNPTMPVVSVPPLPRETEGKLVIGRLTVEVVQPPPVTRKATVAPAPPIAAKPKPKSRESRFSNKLRFGLGQI